MQAGALHYVFCGEGEALFVAGYSLVLGPVIHVQPAYVFEHEDEREIHEKYDEL